MTRFLKSALCVGLLVAGVRGAFGFVVGGPINEVWQVPTIGYNLPGDICAPKNIGEEYRRNKPLMFYSFDQSFLEYFGSNGVWAVEQAFAIMNALTNVSSYSAELTEFPLSSKGLNYRASALGLLDVKSAVLSLLVEQMGLAEPERFTWSLHNRTVGQGGCPNDVDYFVTMRNLAIVPSDLDQVQYSAYVNGALYSYFIDEDCNVAPFDADPAAMAIPFQVDPINDFGTPVASFQLNTIDLGGFYTGLTRDDVAGLRYLMRAGNLNWESLGTNSLMLSTNLQPAGFNFLITSNLADLAQVALTNNAAALQAAYPNLLVLSTMPYLTNVITTNLFAYFTNYPWSPANTPATLLYATNYDTNVVFNYRHTFGNVISNTFIFPNGYVFTNQNIFALSKTVTSNRVTVIETNIGPPSSGWSYPIPALTTNVKVTTMWTNMVVGDYFIPPTNLCGVLLLSNVLTKVTAVTNTPLQATNVVNTNGQFYSLTYVTYLTNHHFAYFPVDCVTNATMLFRGIERVRFVRRDYDSLIGRFFEQVQTNYTVIAVTNGLNITQNVSRVVSQPDFLFTATDFAPGPADPRPILYPRATRGIAYDQSNILPNLAGPGTIEPTTLFTFDKAGPVYYNYGGGSIFYLDELTAIREPLWASFDDSTNAPVVFPNGTSLEALENQIIMGITSTALPDGQVSFEYSEQLAAQGGTLPYTWGLSPLSAGLPPGLHLSAGGLLSGTPTEAGTYDFTIRMTDSGARYVEMAFTLVISP